MTPDRGAGLAARGRARVLARFTQAQIAEATARVYETLTTGVGRTGRELEAVGWSAGWCYNAGRDGSQ